MQLNIKYWLQISLVNLCIVAILGVLMRYKIGFEFPFLNQKYLQHAHSHFAFSGWVSHTLMALMPFYLKKKVANFNSKKYRNIIIANLICAYGMLVFFIYQGYGLYSIIFSTASILVSYLFSYYYFQDLKQLKEESLVRNWFKAALFFNVLSSLGTFYLAYMMASKNIVQEFYLSSIYFYLHFQYNGWFFFGCMGLLFGFLNLKKTEHHFYNSSFKLFLAACIPAYFLSTLWLDLPLWLYALTVLAAIIQTYAWFKLLFVLFKNQKDSLKKQPPMLRFILIFVGVALGLKVLLQLGSTLPYISQLAFGFRPIIIAYLHLVLVAIISLFLLFYIYSNHLLSFTKKIKWGIVVFIIGLLLNEIILGLQGLAAFSYILIPFANELLFVAALFLFIGIALIANYSIKKKIENQKLE